MLPPLPPVSHLFQRAQSLFQAHSLPLVAVTDFLGGESDVQQLLTSHVTFYTLRQIMYGGILNVSELYREAIRLLNSATVTDVAYFGVVVVAVGMFLNDTKYNKTVKRIIAKGTVDKNTKHMLEFVFLVVTLVLFQNVEVATG
jgi:hypothetical protein